MFPQQKKHPELFALSCITAFIVLSLQRWIENSVSLFSNANGLPLAIGIIGIAFGLARGNLHSKHISFAFIAMSCTLLFMSLVVCVPSTIPLPMPVLEPSSALSALVLGPFLFSYCAGARCKELFKTDDFRCWAAMAFGFFWGFCLFTLTSVTGSFPAVQLVIAGLLLVLLSIIFWRPASLHLICLLISCGVLVLAWKTETTHDVVWSMYHRFELKAVDHKVLSGKSPALVDIDRTLQGFYKPEDPAAVPSSTGELVDKNAEFSNRTAFLRLPYLNNKPSLVLVLGTGLGEDISQALKAGATYIDAVELDPVLLELGKAFDNNYASPLVHVVNADPRNYINSCDKKYDTIILGCLDVQKDATTLSHFRDVSLYTKDSYRKCLNLLKPNGNLLISCAAADSKDADILCQRFYATANQALTEKPVVVGGSNTGWSPFLFRLNKTPQKPPALHEVAPFSVVLFGPNAKFQILSEDLPYICLRAAPLSLTCFALFVVAAAAIGFAPSGSANNLVVMARERQSLLVATGFALAISGTVNRCELLLGSSWHVGAIAYGAFLLLNWRIIAAYIDAEAGRIEHFLYPTLLASLLVSFLLPIHWLSKWGIFGLVVILFLTVLPVLRILLIIPSISARSESLQKALVFNLLGFALGILLQPAAIILGNNSLFLIALIACVIAMYLDIKFGNKLAKVENKPTFKRIA